MNVIRVAVIAPKAGIGGGNRKFRIYFDHFPRRMLEAFYVTLAESGAVHEDGDGAFRVPRTQLEQFLRQRHIQFVMLGSRDDALENAIKRAATPVRIVNFTPYYTADPQILNCIISKTDYWKIRWMLGELPNATVLYNPIDVQKWKSWTGKGKNYRDRFVGCDAIIGRLGRAEPSKWHFLNIAALRKLDKERDYRYGFLFAGAPLLYRLACRTMLSKEMRKRVVLLPELRTDAELAAFYNSLDAFWQTAWIGESFGNVIAEAFSFGVPSLVQDHQFLRRNGTVRPALYNAQCELVDDGTNGAYCSTPESVVRFLRSTPKRALVKMGVAGRAKADRLYDARIAGRTLAKILYDTLRGRGEIERNTVFERLVRIPAPDEIAAYDTECRRRLAIAQRRSKHSLGYTVAERCWRGVEYCYLAVRSLGRLVGVDLERSKALQEAL